MKSTLLLLVSATIALGWFGTNVRIDHEDRQGTLCQCPAITLGPGTGSRSQPMPVEPGCPRTYSFDVLRGPPT